VYILLCEDLALNEGARSHIAVTVNVSDWNRSSKLSMLDVSAVEISAVSPGTGPEAMPNGDGRKSRLGGE
jgi:hypothetical protein